MFILRSVTVRINSSTLFVGIINGSDFVFKGLSTVHLAFNDFSFINISESKDTKRRDATFFGAGSDVIPNLA